MEPNKRFLPWLPSGLVAVVAFSLGLAMGNAFAPLPDGGRQKRENEQLHARVAELSAELKRLTAK